MGVAARLSQYLRVLTQARKMGQERISSQEISEYTNINATQIRRDLSAFGKFGKRGVGYNVDGLIAEIRKILRTQGQHNIALFGAGRLGQAIASSTDLRRPRLQHRRRVRHGREQGGRAHRRDGHLRLRPAARAIRDKNIIVAVLAVPPEAAQRSRTRSSARA